MIHGNHLRNRARASLVHAAVCTTLVVAANASVSPYIDITSGNAIVHLGSIDSFDVTEGGTNAARALMEALETGQPGPALRARGIYDKLIPAENFGGEYTALQWFCELKLADEPQRADMLADPFVRAFHDFFADNDFANLREYLNRKHHLHQYGDEDTIAAKQREASLEDFMLFNNPMRPSWEKTSLMLDAMGLREGDSVADVGSGPGFLSFQFAKRVGSTGKVFAIEVNSDHVKYVRETADRLDVGNLETLQSQATDIGMKGRQADVVCLCSLYHIIYTVYSAKDRTDFIDSIKSALKPDGRVVLIDNGPVNDEKLPYHGPYIAKELVIAQLAHHGLRLTTSHQFIPQRYMLTFVPDESVPAGFPEAPPISEGVERIYIPSGESLVHIPNDLSARPIIAARKPAARLRKALESGDLSAVTEARTAFQSLVESENVGDEYSAYIWICDYLLTDEGKRAAMRSEPIADHYLRALAANGYQPLKDYLTVRYFLDEDADKSPADLLARPSLETPGTKPAADGAVSPQKDPTGNEFVSITDSLAIRFLDKGRDPRSELVKRMSSERQAYWRDFILFNNPNRAQWENTSAILETVAAAPGETIADIGCGAGYYSIAFAKAVGSQGKVFATDTNKAHLDCVAELAGGMGLQNVSTIQGRLDNSMLGKESVDKVFMCSLFTPVYTTGINKVTTSFLTSLRESLRSNGRLIIVDNAVVAPGTRPYHGPFMSEGLIKATLRFHGFTHVDTRYAVPQRYVMTFTRSR